MTGTDFRPARERRDTLGLMAMKFTELLGGAALFGVAGWGMEYAWRTVQGEEPYYSSAFKGAKVPFLPVHAAGGGLVLAIAPTLREQGWPWPLRGAAYAGVLSALEWAACQTDRQMMGERSWDYGKDAPADGCVDWKHAIAWGALGLLAESLINGKGSPRAPKQLTLGAGAPTQR